jgi:hypothetical protein
MKKIVCLIIMIIFCSGCAHKSNVEIIAYYKEPPEFLENNYYFYRLKGTWQETSLGYDYLATIISKKLDQEGMKETSPAQAKYQIVVNYIIGDPLHKTGYETTYGIVGSQITGSTTDYYWRGQQTQYTSTPVIGATGVVPYNYDIFPFSIDFLIFKKGDAPNGKPIYKAEITAQDSNSSSNMFLRMIYGFLQVFPGQNGQTVFIYVPPLTMK